MKLDRPHHNLFDKWDEISSYIFGFWLSDGCITLHSNGHSKSTQKAFVLYNTEKQIMLDFLKIFPVNLRSEDPSNPKWKTKYKIFVYSDALFDFCYSVTKTTQKSRNTFLLPTIPDRYYHHFVRGFFDGDGSICYKHYLNRHKKMVSALITSFTGGSETLHVEQLRDELKARVGVGNKKVSAGTAKKLSYNQYDSMLLCEYMYSGATIFMKRKKDVWDSADKTRLLNSKKYFSNKV